MRALSSSSKDYMEKENKSMTDRFMAGWEKLFGKSQETVQEVDEDKILTKIYFYTPEILASIAKEKRLNPLEKEALELGRRCRQLSSAESDYDYNPVFWYNGKLESWIDDKPVFDDYKTQRARIETLEKQGYILDDAMTDSYLENFAHNVYGKVFEDSKYYYSVPDIAESETGNLTRRFDKVTLQEKDFVDFEDYFMEQLGKASFHEIKDERALSVFKNKLADLDTAKEMYAATVQHIYYSTQKRGGSFGAEDIMHENTSLGNYQGSSWERNGIGNLVYKGYFDNDAETLQSKIINYDTAYMYRDLIADIDASVVKENRKNAVPELLGILSHGDDAYQFKTKNWGIISPSNYLISEDIVKELYTQCYDKIKVDAMRLHTMDERSKDYKSLYDYTISSQEVLKKIRKSVSELAEIKEAGEDIDLIGDERYNSYLNNMERYVQSLSRPEDVLSGDLSLLEDTNYILGDLHRRYDWIEGVDSSAVTDPEHFEYDANPQHQKEEAQRVGDEYIKIATLLVNDYLKYKNMYEQQEGLSFSEQLEKKNYLDSVKEYVFSMKDKGNPLSGDFLEKLPKDKELEALFNRYYVLEEEGSTIRFGLPYEPGYLEKLQVDFRQVKDAFDQKLTEIVNNYLGNGNSLEVPTPVQGLEQYNQEELKSIVEDFFNDRFDGVDNAPVIKGIELYGSRGRGTARTDSDLDVVVEYEGDWKEDSVFNVLHEEDLNIDGVSVDINPITDGQSGTLEKYMDKVRKYDEQHFGLVPDVDFGNTIREQRYVAGQYKEAEMSQLYQNERTAVGYSGFYKEVLDKHEDWREAVNDLYARADTYYNDANHSKAGDAADLWKQGFEFEEAGDTLLQRLHATSLWKAENVDHDYLFAVKRGDMNAAQQMVNLAAERAGYSSSSSYQGTSAFNGAAPWGNGYFMSPAERKAAWDEGELDGDQTLADYIDNGVDGMNLDFIAMDSRHYRSVDSARKEAILNVRSAINSKKAHITMYRSVPANVKEESFRNGDWVTPSKAYAEENARVHGWGDNYRIIEQEVSTSEIWWDGNDIAEWGYGREEDYVKDKDFAYKNTANNKKLLDAVVFDDNGEVIPLSKRFNENVDDIRYQTAPTRAELNREERELRDTLIGKLRSAGIEVITDVQEGQAVLDMERKSARTMSFGEVYDYDKYPLGRVEPNLAAARVNIVSATSNHGFKDYKEAKEWAYANICKNYSEAETGGKGIVNINTEVVNKYVSKAARDKSDSDSLHYAVLKVLPDLVREGLDAETHPNFKKVNKERKPEYGIDKNLLIHRVYAAVSVDDNLCRVKITMKENMTGHNVPNRPYSYEVTDISTKIEPLGTIDVHDRSEDGIPISSILGANLLKNVEMSYDKGKKLLEESEKISKNIREQRVYHGSGANFDKFDLSYIRQGEGNLAFGWGVYVTTSKTIGKSYSRLMDEDPTRTMYATRFSNGQRFLKKWPTLDTFLSDKKVKASGWSDEDKKNYYSSHSKDAEPYHNLYEVEIPDDNGENYLTWKLPLSSEQIETIQLGLAKLMDNPSVSDNLKKKLLEWNNGYPPVINVSPGMTGEKAYSTISENLLDEDTSKFLSSLGFSGIKYPAGTIMGGAEKGDINYVIFKEDDLKIKDHLRFFKSKGGETYGYTIGGKIYVDPRIATAETPIHEYTHLWATAIQKGNPKEWSNIVGLMKGTSVWNEIEESYPDLKTDDAIADEVLATYSGRRGAEKLRQMQDGIKATDSTTRKSEMQKGIFRLTTALDKFWKAVSSFLGIHYESAEQVADRALADMLHGINPAKQLREYTTSRDIEYMEAVKSGNMEKAFSMVKEQANMMLADNPMPEVTDAYRVKDMKPQKTIKVYKVFTMDKEGNPTAMFVSGNDKLPIGVWMDAQDTWHFKGENGRDYIPSTRNPNGRGNKTGISMPIPSEEIRQELIKRKFLPEGSMAKNITVLAYRPGWHAADLPYFPQGGKQQAESNYGNVHRHNHVVFECELAADVDYTEKAHAQYKAHKSDGTFIPRNADLQYMPKEGFYKYTTNQFLKDEDKGHWYIGGAMKINRALTQEECDKILAENGKPAQEWEQGILDLAKLGYAVDNDIHTKPVLAPTAYDEKGNLIPLSKRFLPMDEKSHLGKESQDRLRKLFIGERGAKAADLADSVKFGLDNNRLGMLSLAKTMLSQNSSAKDIKHATGWELGADGNWRFEVPDVKKFDWYGNLSYAKDHPEYQRYFELKQKESEHLFDEGEALRPSEEQELDLLSEKYGGEEKKYDDNHTLEAYIDAPEAFNAYPDLRKVNVDFKPLDDHTMAYYQGKTLLDYMLDGSGNTSQAGTIVINTKKFCRFTDPKEICPVVAHEMQHAVQQIEGFAKGGDITNIKKDIQETLNSHQDQMDFIKYNLKMWVTYESAAKKLEMYKQNGPDTEIGKLKRFSWYWDAMNEIDSNYDDKFQLKNNYEKDLGRHLDAKAISETGYHVDEAIQELKRVATEYKDALCKHDYITLDRMNRLDDAFQSYTEAEMYHNLAGEVEARNTEARNGMTALQRRNSLASDTEDVDRKKQIVIFRTDAEPLKLDKESKSDGRWHTPEISVREVYAEYGKFLSAYLRDVGQSLKERLHWNYNEYIPMDATGQRFKGVDALMLTLTHGFRTPVFFTEEQVKQAGYYVDQNVKPFSIIKAGGVVKLYNLDSLLMKSEQHPDKMIRVAQHVDYAKKYEEWKQEPTSGIKSIDAFDTKKYSEFGIEGLQDDYKPEYNRGIIGSSIFSKMRELDGKESGQSSEELVTCLGNGLMGQEYGYEYRGCPDNAKQLGARLERDSEYVKHVLDEASRTWVKSATFIEESVRTWSEDKKLDLRSLTPVDIDNDGNGIVDSEENLAADTKQGEGEVDGVKKHESRKFAMKLH